MTCSAEVSLQINLCDLSLSKTLCTSSHLLLWRQLTEGIAVGTLREPGSATVDCVPMQYLLMFYRRKWKWSKYRWQFLWFHTYIQHPYKDTKRYCLIKHIRTPWAGLPKCKLHCVKLKIICLWVFMFIIMHINTKSQVNYTHTHIHVFAATAIKEIDICKYTVYYWITDSLNLVNLSFKYILSCLTDKLSSSFWL